MRMIAAATAQPVCAPDVIEQSRHSSIPAYRQPLATTPRATHDIQMRAWSERQRGRKLRRCPTFIDPLVPAAE